MENSYDRGLDTFRKVSNVFQYKNRFGYFDTLECGKRILLFPQDTGLPMTYDENVITIYWSGFDKTYLSQGDQDDHFKLANHRSLGLVIAASYPTVIWVVPAKTGTWDFGSMPQWFVSAIENGDVLFVPDEEYPEYGRFMVGENVGPILFNNNGKLEVFTRDEYRFKYFL